MTDPDTPWPIRYPRIWRWYRLFAIIAFAGGVWVLLSMTWADLTAHCVSVC